MKSTLINFSVAYISLIILDVIWFKFSGDFFLNHMKPLVKFNEEGMIVKIWAALVVYFFLAAGLTLFAFPQFQDSIQRALLFGFLFGFITYGIYDFTNHATLKTWPMQLMAIDMIWGGFSCATTSVLWFKFFK